MFNAPNHTQVPNQFFDEMLRGLDFAETKMLLVIFRKTFGWHKKRDWISLSQFEEYTGLTRRSILRAADSLEKKNLIKKQVEGEQGDQKAYYELVIQEQESGGDQYTKYTPPQCTEYTPPSVLGIPTKETLTKEKEDSNAKFSAENLLSECLLRKLKTQKENFSGKITPRWLKDSKKLLGMRSPEEIRKVIDWVFDDPFWSGVVMSPGNLVKNLDKIEVQMLRNSKPKDSPISRFEDNKRLGGELEQSYSGRDIDFYGDYIGFKFGPLNYVCLNYKDFGFRDQLENNLRKLGLSLHQMASQSAEGRQTG